MDKTYKTIIFEWASLAGIVVGCFLFLHNQISSIDEKLEKQCKRTDKLYEMLLSQHKQQSERTDQLYQMFIDLIKENRNMKSEK